MFHCVLSFVFLESLAVEETLSQLCSELQVTAGLTPWVSVAVVMQEKCGCLLDKEIETEDRTPSRLKNTLTSRFPKSLHIYWSAIVCLALCWIFWGNSPG